VVAQDYLEWRIVARDDASTDDTAEHLAAWKSRLGVRMTILEDSTPRNLGMVGNYNAVLSATSAPWVMFADPDDVWRPGKLSLTVRSMKEAESAARARTPVLVCTDAEVVNHLLEPLASSYWQWSRMNPELADVLHRMAVESPVLAPMVNRALLDLAMPLIGAASCADWWSGLVASAFGRIVRLPERTFLYRRHPSNDSLDPFGSTWAGAIRRFLATPGEPRRRVERLLRQFAPQAAAFVGRFRERLRPEDIAALETAARLPDLAWFARRWAVSRHGLWFGSQSKNIALLALL
jgi:glycosyltransferase involved in cell wall biosynthesis